MLPNTAQHRTSSALFATGTPALLGHAPSRAALSYQARRTRGRRRGQALLLAVLLMVFAALLGSTFLSIVSVNLNQTARQGDLAASRQSAQAGLSFINERLTNSPEGDSWRPWQVLGSPPPKPGDSSFNFYYTPIERANGWVNEVDFTIEPKSDFNANGISYADAIASRNGPEQQAEIAMWVEAQMAGTLGGNRKRCFVKFPDPRGATSNARSPQYLAEVRAEPPSGTKPAMLKISVIGQNEESPNAFEVRQAFKPSTSQSPLLASARTVTNWDFESNRVPEAQVASVTGSNLNITNRRGSFPAAPFCVTVGGINTPLQTAIVAQVNSPTQLRLSAPITPVVGDRVQLAAVLGAPSGVDYDADGTIEGTSTDASGHRVLYKREAVTFSPAETPGASTYIATRINGGLVWMGNAQLRNNTQVLASGLMALRNVPGVASALPRVTGFDGYNARLTDSRDAGFPIFQGVDENGNAIDRARAQSSIRDGLDRLRNIPNTLRTVDNFTPPTIENSSAGADRYRELSKFSPPNVNIVGYGLNPAGGAGALYGYGEGVYIDNAEDREKVTLAGMAARVMTSTQLRQMLFGSATSTLANLNTSFQRACRPYGVGQTATSGGVDYIPTLEQKHLRGWIGPDEFRARGVLIELAPRERYFSMGANDDRTIYVTLDALSDGGPLGNGTNAHQPDAKKSYRLADGSLPSDALRYRRRLPWPQNGVIFAEGNVRLKGGAFNASGRVDASVDPHRGLTVVTMGSAFIEGSLNAGVRKIAVLARENVLLNPTALISRVEAQTRVRLSGTETSTTLLPVDDSTLFEVGDWVEVENSVPFRVVDKPSDTSIRLSRAYRGSTALPILRAIRDPLYRSGADAHPYFGNATRLGRPSDITQRRFLLPPGALSTRLTLRHSAFRREAFQMRAERTTASPVAPTAIDLSSKMISSADLQSGLITAADKYLRVEHNSPIAAPGPDVFSNAAPTDANDLKNSMRFRLGLAGALEGIEKQVEDANASHAPQMWSYNTTDTKAASNYDSESGATSPLWFFLAASSNRHSFGSATGEMLRRKQSLLRTTPSSLPMGVSIAAFFNAAPSPAGITSDHFNPTTRAFDERVTQFGFNPQLDGVEDALTMDETFYTGALGASPALPAASADPSGIDLAFDSTDYVLDSRAFEIASTSTSGQNSLALMVNNQTVKLDAARDTGQALDSFFVPGRARMPYYRLSRLKLDTPNVPEPVFDTSSGQLARIAPGTTMEVQAFVYAQRGSWMVIPGDFYDSSLKTDAAGSYITRADGISRANIDLNRDGVTTRDERTSVFRLRRYNYKILFRGAIAENQTLPVIAETPEPGAVGEWMDKWAAFRFTQAGGDFDDARRDGIADSSATARLSQAELPLNDANANANFGNITYEFDSSLSSPTALRDTGFRPPVSPELTYTS